MYCLSVYLTQIQSYHAFTNMAVDHWCLSLIPPSHAKKIQDVGIIPRKSKMLITLDIEEYSSSRKLDISRKPKLFFPVGDITINVRFETKRYITFECDPKRNSSNYQQN